MGGKLIVTVICLLMVLFFYYFQKTGDQLENRRYIAGTSIAFQGFIIVPTINLSIIASYF
jgi:hypothetical protein